MRFMRFMREDLFSVIRYVVAQTRMPIFRLIPQNMQAYGQTYICKKVGDSHGAFILSLFWDHS
jgi:hypothetical protein